MSKDKSLRPSFFNEYIGQNNIIRQLKTFTKATQLRKEKGWSGILDHMIFEGSAGLGKTSIAFVIANEMNSDIKITQGTSMESVADLVSNIINLEEGDIFFIDEIHALKGHIEEALYSIMEDFRLDILPQTPNSKPISVGLPKFTLIGATTEMGKIKKPLQDRFVHKFTLERYTIDELSSIIIKSSELLECDIDNESAELLASYSRGVPRVANNLLRKTVHYADVFNESIINTNIVELSLRESQITLGGLDTNDRIYLKSLEGGSPIGLKTITSMTNIDEYTIENNIEPYLLENGYVEKRSRGRVITEKGLNYLLIV